MDEKDAIQSVGMILAAFLKSGPQSGDPEKTQNQILKIVEATIVTPRESTQRYKKRCDDFMETVIKAKGLPIRQVMSDHRENSASRSDSKRAAKSMVIFLPKLVSQHALCVENYGRQSRLYFDGEMNQFHDMLQRFLQHVPAGGSADREAKLAITGIKKAFRDLTKWDKLFSTIKVGSFPAAISRTLELEGNPLAAIWRYSPLDEQGEFRNAYSHKELDGRIYCVPGNWAIEKRLMKAGTNGYIDNIAQPGEDFDCMCYYQWIYNLGSLPENMLTAEGQAGLNRAKKELDKLLGDISKKEPAEIVQPRDGGRSSKYGPQRRGNIARVGIVRRVINWLGRSGS